MVAVKKEKLEAGGYADVRDMVIRRRQTPEELEAVAGTQAKDEGFEGVRTARDPGEFSVEIVPRKNTIWDLELDSDIFTHRYGKLMDKVTYRAQLTRNGRVTPLARKLISLILAGKSYTYIARAAGLTDATFARYIFLNNPVIRNAVLEQHQLLVEESSDNMVRAIRKITRNLIHIAAGESESPPNRQKVELMGIQEYFNRLGYGAARVTGKVNQDDLTVRMSGREGQDLTVLVQRRQARLKQYAGNGSEVSETVKKLEDVLGEDDIEGEVIVQDEGEYESS